VGTHHNVADWLDDPLVVDLRVSVGLRQMPALVDALCAGTLNDSQRETVHVHRDGLLGLVGQMAETSIKAGSACYSVGIPKGSGEGQPEFTDQPLPFSVCSAIEDFCLEKGGSETEDD
jgi:hypothetical protein